MTAVKFVDVVDKEAIFEGNGWDALVVVSADLKSIKVDEVAMLADHGQKVDQRVGKSVTLLFAPGMAGGRLVIAPVKKAADEYEDVRVFADAARSGIRVAKEAGAKRPLLLVNGIADARYQKSGEVAALACGQELWQALELREAGGADEELECIGLLSDTHNAATLTAIEEGRTLARDLCGTEPERMSAPAFADYCLAAFTDSGLTISVVEDRDILERDYPLLCAVGRSSFAVLRHQPRVLKLEYVGEGDIQRTFLFAGKGVIYDTGGADIKIAGGMAGMSRDKGGAAAVAGLMKTVSMLKPKGIRIVAELGLVRNSIGSEAFVTDEIIASHAGKRVRIGNTDAEGRLVLADLLSHLRIKAESAVSPEMFSVATLTGHVVRCFGGYTAAVENSVAKQANVAERMQQKAAVWGEPIEVSQLRRDDFSKIVDPSGAADMLSSNNAPSSVTARGHQYPAAFLIQASGLSRHGLNSDKPIAYTHLDIAGSATEGHPQYGSPTATPLVGLFNYMVDSQ
ncbi:peptidase M17 [Shewanella sp. Choline-02u-19]|jgi:leucyl aminopeptidase|uniref:M17 family metallopeptidase n=1 Tax=unclassified Shewanella TaxID=196818 RepID=UPI000C34D2F6|nr:MULTISPECIES: leucyl aminopeptidase family protein [unclassified Shewanella]PKG55066.1 peptidase M17 [Shewanella sp. GutDb-MelDb]PKH58473.1 peptidase M17 [Shewanella sp. Bg11-22]PKI26546.1 peptidase M17 [Shewanella sp. Choline-02u-19]